MSMKKYIIQLLCMLSPLLIKAQQVTGKVMEAGTKTPVAKASVYFSGSVNGTSTNDQGLFKIYSGQNKVPIVISCVGYYSTVVNVYSFDKPTTVYLKPKLNLMRQVQIGDDGMKVDEKQKTFIREFLGTSSYAKSCTITNLSDVDLSYDKNTATLSAYCNKPLIIKNKKLAYTITYYLDNFEFSINHIVNTGGKVNMVSGRLIYSGNYLFAPDSITDANEIKKVMSNREDAYSGSRMQFIRALVNNGLDNAGFTVYDNNDKKRTAQGPDGVVFVDVNNENYLAVRGRINIKYKGEVSQIGGSNEFAYITKNGFYSPGITWFGDMTIQRTGDLLPFEYASPQDKKDIPKL